MMHLQKFRMVWLPLSKDLTPVTYKHIAVTIDFSKNDTNCIRNAIMQGGKDAEYTLIHVVETAGARYYGTEVMDHETQSDVDNLDTYVKTLTELGYNANPHIGSEVQPHRSRTSSINTPSIF